MIPRVLLIGFVIYALVMAFIYGYKAITKEDFKHTFKLVFGGVLTFAIILILLTLEMQ